MINIRLKNTTLLYTNRPKIAERNIFILAYCILFYAQGSRSLLSSHHRTLSITLQHGKGLNVFILVVGKFRNRRVIRLWQSVLCIVLEIVVLGGHVCMVPAACSGVYVFRHLCDRHHE